MLPLDGNYSNSDIISNGKRSDRVTKPDLNGWPEGYIGRTSKVAAKQGAKGRQKTSRNSTPCGLPRAILEASLKSKDLPFLHRWAER